LREPLKATFSQDIELCRAIERLLNKYGFERCAPSRNPQILKALKNSSTNRCVLVLNTESPEQTAEIEIQRAETLSIGPGRTTPNTSVAEPTERDSQAGSQKGLSRGNGGAPLESRSSKSSHVELDEGDLPRSEDLVDGDLFIGNSLSVKQIKSYIKRVAATDSSILITGETGTGKEVVASLIVKNSSRGQKPFVCVNCAAIPDSLLESELFGYERGAFTGAVSSRRGKLELANGGTVFLDEIGDMSPYAQAKILRVIESKEVQRLGGKKDVSLDIRFIAASNRDLDSMSTDDRFRKDLYFRLNVARVHIPPLRERRSDLSLLFDHFIQEFNGRFRREIEGFTQNSLQSLLNYDWPGNVRELRNLVEACFLNLPRRRVVVLDLPDQIRKRLAPCANVANDERERLLTALSSTHWNKSEAARQLHWSRMTLYRKMVKYQIA